MGDNTLVVAKNRTRQIEFDLAKALAAIFMIFVHTYEMSLFIANDTSGIGLAVATIIELLGSVLTAPLFMFAMGVGAVYSKHSKPDQYIKRATKIFGLGIFVNFF